MDDVTPPSEDMLVPLWATRLFQGQGRIEAAVAALDARMGRVAGDAHVGAVAADGVKILRHDLDKLEDIVKDLEVQRRGAAIIVQKHEKDIDTLWSSGLNGSRDK
jgi:creatinine amidohydrolase/Fe(II)-dependent formamide hydrolase-like protein